MSARGSGGEGGTIAPVAIETSEKRGEAGCGEPEFGEPVDAYTQSFASAVSAPSEH